MPRGRSFNAQIDESLFGNPNASALKSIRSRPPELRSLSVVSGGELSNIAYRATAPLGPQGDGREGERQRLKALSESRKAKWPNTLEAARAKKERARQDKADADERMRQAIDREEEGLQAEKRRLAIERANKMLYDQTDRVKALHSKLLLCDVIAERERQIVLKKTINQRSSIDDARWYAKEQAAIRRMDEEEDAREAEHASKKEVVAKVRLEQLELQRMRHEKKKKEREEEGMAMRTLTMADLEREKFERMALLERQEQQRHEFLEANHHLTQERAKERLAIEAEEVRMRAYATEKETKLLQRRDREEQRFRERQAWRQKLIDSQIARLQDTNAENEARLQAQAMDVQVKAMEARARLDEKKKDEMLITHMSRQQQMRWKAEKRLQAQSDDVYFQQQQQILNAELREEEAAALQQTYEKRKNLDAFLLKQMIQKRGAREEELKEELFVTEMSKQFNGDDHAIYEQYAQMCLDEYVAAGKDPRPIKLMLQKELNKSYAD
jgi:hypothetical protein